MAQRKILLDTCSYLRLAELVDPLLDFTFGEDNCCLYVIHEFQKEYDKQPRLQNKFPYMNEDRYRDNRKKRINLSKEKTAQIPQVIEAFDDFAYEEDLGPSYEDLTALARAYLCEIELVTDDNDLIEVAVEFEVKVMNTLELIKFMLDKERIDLQKVKELCEYLEGIPDKPKNYLTDRQRLFGF